MSVTPKTGNSTFRVDVCEGKIRKYLSADTAEQGIALEVETRRVLRVQLGLQPRTAEEVAALIGALRDALGLKKLDQQELKQTASEAAPDCWTLSEAIACAFTNKWTGGKSERFFASNAEMVKAFFGSDTPVDKITLHRIDAFINFCRDQGNSDKTINKKISTLMVPLKLAKERGKMKEVPKVSRRKEGKGNERWLSPGEEVMMLGLMKQWGKAGQYEWIIFLTDTGCRVGESKKVTARHCNFKTQIVNIPDSKTGTPRGVPMTRRVRTILERRCMDNKNGPIFPYTYDFLSNAWDSARAVMDLATEKGFSPHCLRHTCATRMVESGVDIRMVKDYLGHATITTTMKYAHLAPKHLYKAAHALDAFNAGADVEAAIAAALLSTPPE